MCMRKLLLAGIISSSLFVSGCGKEMVYKPVALPLPPKPELPAIHSDEINCLSDDTYRKFVDRDLIRKHYEERLELIIKSTHDRK